MADGSTGMLPELRASVPRLTADRESELARMSRGGDRSARDELVRCNVAMVVRLARRYAGWGLGFDDLVGHGLVALVVLVDGFDPGRGLRFSTYAWASLGREMRHAIVKHAYAVDLPCRMPKYLPSYWEAAANSWDRDWEHAWIGRVKAEHGLDDAEAGHVLAAARATRGVSGDSPGSSDDGNGVFEQLASSVPTPLDEALAGEEEARLAATIDRRRPARRLPVGAVDGGVDAILRPLPSHIRRVVAGHVLGGKSMADLGREMRFTAAKIEWMYRKGVVSLRNHWKDLVA